MTPPFADLLADAPHRDALRRAVTAATRRAETDCLPPLIEAARLDGAAQAEATALARDLVTTLRARPRRGGVEALVQEFSLSSEEGVALMCLAEALLRIPDDATRDALIRDKIGGGDWAAHLGHSPSLFVNAATWGLVVTGRLSATATEGGLGAALTRLVARAGEPVIRRGMDMAMRMMGEQFVRGETIEEALKRARAMEAKGFRHSFDMLGEAAMTAGDAARYLSAYEGAIHAIGQASAGRGIIEGPGISIKLSALHPRYSRAQRGRVMAELLPRLLGLARLARRHDIGLNIDAEESERLELSLDLLQALCRDEALASWNGIGFVIQAYQKRAPFVIDVVADMARRTGRRMMVRLVKGAYWDSEIKRAQLDGQADFPVFTRKVHTDVSYLACAKRMLAAPDAIFPQFATHNAMTVGAIHAMAGPDADYEFQCLHGMGEPLYEAVVQRLGRACRIYAPVGTHETLLAYLVRRLLENGANSSFVNRIHDPAVPVAALLEDPVAVASSLTPVGRPHDGIAAPRAILGATRANSAGMDLADEDRLEALAATLRAGVQDVGNAPRPVLNPADTRDIVGTVRDATPDTVRAAIAAADSAAPGWEATPAATRAAMLERAADLMEARMPALLGPIVREAGKSLPNAIAEVREAVDFLRYYAAESRGLAGRALGPVACIAPWNFPLAIFTGQVAAALAAGNTVLAKPAEEVPLIGGTAVAILHEAGVPRDVLHLVLGDGTVGAALVADPRVQGVMFTGSTEVARLINRELAKRLGRDGLPVPLVAETGGQNALVVDSSAQPEQVVADVLASAFDSAGQRCSALRLLCVQDDVAESVIAMLKGAMAELRVGRPDRLDTDVGPVISAEARQGLLAHVAAMRASDHVVHALALPPDCDHGHFVAPTLIEIDDVSALTKEVFGPVLHVLRFKREDMDALIRDIAATGYALTFGVHSRIDETIDRLVEAAPAGNVYVNRSIIGAVVGVQPFGGHGLSGTGPKAGGPLYLRRLMRTTPSGQGGAPTLAAARLLACLRAEGHHAAARFCADAMAASPLGIDRLLPGPVGESNRYRTEPRGRILAVPVTEEGAWRLAAAALATGNAVRVVAPATFRLPPGLVERVEAVQAEDCAAVLAEAEGAALVALATRVAALDGPVRPVLVLRPGGDAAAMDMLVAERAISTNTAAAGGNASLMSLG
jgi:RHH-type proline utilization regulon transcriptional repressor/proline dehydrogenase/delta 1-pyrroline-5-carboxylate dehydrogenase